MPNELDDELLLPVNLWRSKEQIRSRISSREFDPDLYRIYGEILLRMHDTLDAGRYLFFSGARASQYQQAIELFLSRFGGNTPARLFAQAPRPLRKSRNLEEYLSSSGFEQCGWTPEMLEVARRPTISRMPKNQSWLKRTAERLKFGGIVAILGFLVVSMVLGSISILRAAISVVPISDFISSVLGRSFMAAIVLGGLASILWRITSWARQH